MRQLLADTNGVTTNLLLDCLSPAVTKSATELHEVPAHLPRDIGLFETYHIIPEPLDEIFKNNATWRFNKYPLVVKSFEMSLKTDREQVYNSSISKVEN